MQQFERPISVGMYSQPVTDITGALLARVSGPVAAYNWLVLLSFPLVCGRSLPACAPSGAFAGGRDRRRDGLRVLPVPSGARRLSPAHRANAMAAAVPARAVALSRRGHAGSGRLSWRRDAGRDALELLRWLDRRRHHPGRRGRVLARHAAGSTRGRMRRLARHRRQPRADRRLRDGVRARTRPAPSSRTARRSRFHEPTCSSTARNGGAISFRRSRIPLLGATAHRMWNAAGVRDGLLEQQVSLGWGIVALGAHRRRSRWLMPQSAAGVARARVRSSSSSP